MLSYTIYGLVSTADFQKCREVHEHLRQTHSDTLRVSVVEEMPQDFYQRRERWVKAGIAVDPTAPVVALCDGDSTALSAQGFLAKAQQLTSYRVVSVADDHPDSYVNRAQRSWLAFLRNRGNRYCWMDVQVGGQAVGRVTFEVYSKLLPRTAQNFCLLCRGDMDDVAAPGTGGTIHLSYKGTTFFRVLKDAWVMAGDISPGHTGNGGHSCYGPRFPDESFAVAHDAPGVLGMCNDGEHTNASSFYVTRKKMSWMNGHYVAFGRVMDGMDVIDAIHDAETKHNQAPRETILITDCGEYDVSM
ncbi:peptidylprolyl isomerase [Strigomonas culicis]|uniref:Peptidyl-prolyl cis-trans isomerase n=1 Tax=Strigomonas culicis TaxID=28005 RepID=S9TWJ0_9TRYP|nr:peptidylprolyl isomerase [Strigomonas culicis]EPY27934.1 peptidylprolyl isomerase [Strigomonas culicis]|eukprot:EPY20973.1 peptidylprolyl isomerase [Strigomonas culicis]